MTTNDDQEPSHRYEKVESKTERLKREHSFFVKQMNGKTYNTIAKTWKFVFGVLTLPNENETKVPCVLCVILDGPHKKTLVIREGHARAYQFQDYEEALESLEITIAKFDDIETLDRYEEMIYQYSKHHDPIKTKLWMSYRKNVEKNGGPALNNVTEYPNPTVEEWEAYFAERK